MEQKRLLELLIENFEKRLSSSRDKKTLLIKEIATHEYLFDDSAVPPTDTKRPILHYNIGDIMRIREAYNRFIVNGESIDNAGIQYNYKKTLVQAPPTDFQTHYFNEAMARFDYLQYLKNYKPEIAIEPPKRTLADIALQYVWEGKTITNQNKDEIAAQFPELKLKNGNKLYNDFLHYSHKTNRVNYDGSERQTRNYLKDMERALSFLTNPEHIKVAEKEIHEYKRHNNIN